MLKTPSGCVLSRLDRSTYDQYASPSRLPAALPEGRFEHPPHK
jgi:hypothetical protein